MGRLFWKFFFFIWLAQLTTAAGVSTYFWWEHQQDAHWRAMEGEMAARAQPFPPDGPGLGFHPGPLPHGHGDRPPHRPPPRRFPYAPLVAGFFASLIFAALLARYFSRPIRTLRSAFGAAATGNLDIRVASAMGSRRDELADLGRDFDQMAGQLQALVEGQRRLLHDVSHELRSPLARLQAAIGLARQQPAKLESSIARIEVESVRMDRLLDELLTLFRLEAGTTGKRSEEIDVADLLSTVVADASFEAEPKGVAVELAGDCAAWVDGDSELLHRAAENIVRNAVKYTPAGRTVRVSGEMDAVAGRVTIRVEDGGPGVPPEDLEAIFQPFYRSPQAGDFEGHGLGLAIARRVVDSLGGRLRAANLPQGGLRVEIELPARAG